MKRLFRKPQDLEKMRSDFVANISHELRTPLTVLRGYLETIQSGEYKQEQFPRMIFQMQQQTLRMEHLLKDLILLNHLESDSPVDYEKTKIDIAQLLKEIRDNALQLSGDKQHTITLMVETEETIIGIRQEIHSAFSNLVYNAVHYTPDHGEILIRWYQDQSGLHLAVKDNGIGIKSKHIPRLTERFYRVESSRSRNSGGTGLGLAIVKHVLLRHKASLFIDSEPLHGSVFRCDFSPL